MTGGAFCRETARHVRTIVRVPPSGSILFNCHTRSGQRSRIDRGSLQYELSIVQQFTIKSDSSGLTFSAVTGRVSMQIFLRPPNPEALSFEVDFQIQQAIVALRRSSIREGLHRSVLRSDWLKWS